MKQLLALFILIALSACESSGITADDGSIWTPADDADWWAANDSADCGSSEMDAAMEQFTNAASDARGRFDIGRSIAQMRQAQTQMIALNLTDCVLWRHAVIDQYPTDGTIDGGWMAVDVAMWEKIRAEER